MKYDNAKTWIKIAIPLGIFLIGFIVGALVVKPKNTRDEAEDFIKEEQNKSVEKVDQTGGGVLNENPTKEEYEAAVYCDECFKDLESILRKQETLKAQVVQKGVTNSVLKENFFKMEDLATFWQEKATKKPRFKDLPWIKKALVKVLVVLSFVGGIFIGSKGL